MTVRELYERLEELMIVNPRVGEQIVLADGCDCIEPAIGVCPSSTWRDDSGVVHIATIIVREKGQWFDDKSVK